MSRREIREARKGKSPSPTNISELCKTNEFLINQNVRLLAKKETAEARLIVACVFLFGTLAGLTAILITGGPGS